MIKKIEKNERCKDLCVIKKYDIKPALSISLIILFPIVRETRAIYAKYTLLRMEKLYLMRVLKTMIVTLLLISTL